MERPTRLQGLPIFVDIYCLADTNERNFPPSKNRSHRIFKKLVKRFGSEFRKEPAIFQTPEGFMMHPVRYQQLCSELEKFCLPT